MEWFSKLADPIAERYRALTVPTRMGCLALAVAVLTGLVMLAAGRAGGPYQPLFEGRSFSFRELAKMTTAFQAAGLREARLTDGQILVPQAKLDAYLVALDAADALPADFDDSVDEVAAESSPFASRQQTELGYRVAEQKKLARILSGMNGIETASVQYAEVKKPGFPPTSDVRAVVAVRATGNRELTYEEIEAIRDTVAGFVAGLNRDQVTISDLNACRAYPGGDGPGSAGANYAARSERARLEEEFRAKIQNRLTAYPGLIVGVNVQLAEPSEVSVAGATSGGRRRFTPALVSASIDLPKSYFAQVWRERNGNAEGTSLDRPGLQAIEEDIKQTVEQAVLALLPSPAVDLRGVPQVVVTSYDAPPRVETNTAELRSVAAAWIMAHWSLLAAGGVLVASVVLVVCGRRRSAPVASRSQETATAEAASTLASEAFVASDPKPPAAGPEVHVRIHRAIQENPQAAAETLQRWLRKAA
ncbi:MAG: hypothetical protein MUE50_14665 [Pirellulaceae bacterium]|jgi:flagellar biosynthesis/type III secretory pathway M-ring protein FliF/YscJ|nr:hypothetical protein [Pirellulaceae bacterium]